MRIPIVDLFAGPGGLGEGFCTVPGDPFFIHVSAEKDAFARATLRLRAYFRLLKTIRPERLEAYYRFCQGISEVPWDESTHDLWVEAGEEALQLELGKPEDDAKLHARIGQANLSIAQPWLLIGGPPCQAYSLVGRARNRGKAGYRLEEDARSYLYREYLKIIQKYRPAVFVMENVKGILSAKHGAKLIFEQILTDLASPDEALELPALQPGYRIHSLVTNAFFKKGDDPAEFDAKQFIIRAEQFGIPQARHRVILLGIREDICITPEQLRPSENTLSTDDVIGDLPKLRSRLTKQDDGDDIWVAEIKSHLAKLVSAARKPAKRDDKLVEVMRRTIAELRALPLGGNRMPLSKYAVAQPVLRDWYADSKLNVLLNHEARGHMTSDLCRYVFASSFAKAHGRAPRGAEEFVLIPELRPNHENWDTGDFCDRFKVQLPTRPSKTITSHISKDGHAFIHADPAQCRSFTVREAARIQTFPDNYFFQGGRTQQLHQVGNAVPPLLANQIGHIVLRVFETYRKSQSKAA